MQDGIIMIQARRCKRCGRLLTSKEAVERGYGCQCATKARKEEAEKQPIPGQRSIFDYLSEEENGNDEREGTEKQGGTF